jgi:hypothetical protein
LPALISATGETTATRYVPLPCGTQGNMYHVAISPPGFSPSMKPASMEHGSAAVEYAA